MRPAVALIAGATFIAALAGCRIDRTTGRPAAASAATGADSALADTLSALISAAYDFSASDIVEKMFSLYASEGKVISASSGSIIASRDSIRSGLATFWQTAGRNMKNPVWKWHEVLAERLAPGVALFTGRWSIPHIAPGDRPHTIEGVWTAVWRHGPGGWKIVHEHLSSPREPRG